MIHNSTCSVLLNLCFGPAQQSSFASQTCQDSVNTGHEHLDKFNLINMNGRVYDPALARFLSPDPFIQAPGYSQSYNRYSYCLNNPLKYTDPSGYKTQRYDESGNPLYQTYVNWNGVDVSASPGSGNHWSDGSRSLFGNYMLMSPTTFQNFYGVSKNEYNEKIAPNYQSLSTTLTYFQRNSKGELGFYPANVKAERKSYHISVDKDGNVIITEFVEVTSKWVGFDAQGGGDDGFGKTVQTIALTASAADMVISATEQTIQTTRIGANFAYAISGSSKLVKVVSNTIKYGPYVGLGVTMLTGGYLSTEINPLTGRPYQSWAETGTDIGVNIATLYIGAKSGGWYGAGAAAFYIGVRFNVNYQMNNGLNPGMIFIMNKE